MSDWYQDYKVYKGLKQDKILAESPGDDPCHECGKILTWGEAYFCEDCEHKIEEERLYKEFTEFKDCWGKEPT